MPRIITLSPSLGCAFERSLVGPEERELVARGRSNWRTNSDLFMGLLVVVSGLGKQQPRQLQRSVGLQCGLGLFGQHRSGIVERVH